MKKILSFATMGFTLVLTWAAVSPAVAASSVNPRDFYDLYRGQASSTPLEKAPLPSGIYAPKHGNRHHGFDFYGNGVNPPISPITD